MLCGALPMLVCVGWLACAGVVKVQGTDVSEVVLPGDVYIELIETIYLDKACTQIDPRTVQVMEAIKWTLNKLNTNIEDHKDLGNITLGLRVNPTCKSKERAAAKALDIAGKDDVIAVLGAETSEETAIVSKTLSFKSESERLLQVGYSCTSKSLRDRTIYRNFFRTIPADDIQVKVMVELMKKLHWTFVAVIYDNSTYGRGGVKQLQEAIKGTGICFPETIEIRGAEEYSNVTAMEELIQTRVYRTASMSKTESPISGILVFGSYAMTQQILNVTLRLQAINDTFPRPVFLLSDAVESIDDYYTDVSRGSFIVSPPKRIITDFQKHWNSTLKKPSQSDKYARELHEQLFGCNLTHRTGDINYCREVTEARLKPHLTPYPFNQYAMQAALVVAFALKKVINTKCGNYTGNSTCNVTRTPRNEFIEAIHNSEIIFDDDSRIRIREFMKPYNLKLEFEDTCEPHLDNKFSSYDVYNEHTREDGSRNSTLVAEYKKGQLIIDTEKLRDYTQDGSPLAWPNIRKPQLEEGYLSPRCLEEQVDEALLYKQGDIYIVGVVPVHTTGDTPQKCGHLKRGGVDVVEAIRFAIEQENKENKDAAFGYIIIDSCNDPHVVYSEIVSLHKNGLLINGVNVDIGDKILGYVGGWSSDVSVAIAELTTRYKTVQISYGSTAISLSERSRYPHFLRVTNTDDNQARVMLQTILELKGHYIQIMYGETTYGRGGRDMLNKLAKDHGICVVNEIGINADTSFDNIITSLRSVPGAMFVAIFVDSFKLGRIVESLKMEAGVRKNEFLFIASEAWGRRISLDDVEHNLTGTIVVSSEMNNPRTYKTHLLSLKPEESKSNPWLRAYMEMTFHCYYDWSFNKISQDTCGVDEKLGNDGYRFEPWASFALLAVEAMMSAGKKVLKNICETTNAICADFNVTELVEEIKTIQTDEVNTKHVFNSNGDGNIGYNIYTIDDSGQYIPIGESNGQKFSFDTRTYHSIRSVNTIVSTCTGASCRQCTPVQVQYHGECALPVWAIVIMVLLAVVIIALIALVVYMCCRYKWFPRQLEEDPYLTPVYDSPRRDNMDHMGVPIYEVNARGLPTESHRDYDSLASGSTGYNFINSCNSDLVSHQTHIKYCGNEDNSTPLTTLQNQTYAGDSQSDLTICNVQCQRSGSVDRYTSSGQASICSVLSNPPVSHSSFK